MTIHYISLGYDCSPANLLRDLDLRPFALPFDWVVSIPEYIAAAVRDKFSSYHKNLSLIESKTRVVDAYGFLFPHDYPTIKDNTIPICDEDVPVENIIHPDWAQHSEKIQEKYKRRIDRFNTLLLSPDPLIMVCRYQDVRRLSHLRAAFSDCYNKTNIAYVVATSEQSISPDVFTCQPEVGGDWNNKDIWALALKAAADYLEKPN